MGIKSRTREPDCDNNDSTAYRTEPEELGREVARDNVSYQLKRIRVHGLLAFVPNTGHGCATAECLGTTTCDEGSVSVVASAKKYHLSKAADAFAAKLAPRYNGPYQVVDFMSPVICRTRPQNRPRVG